VRGRYTHIDLPFVDFTHDAKPQRRYFAQLGGAGLDARAIELVDWQQKKKFGPFAYVLAGWRALRERQTKITVVTQRRTLTGELVLLGNGELYGGRMRVFPKADLRDGLLDVCVFPRVGFFSMTASALWAVVFGKLPPMELERVRSAEVMLTAPANVGLELDGDFVGRLPAKFGVLKERLRVIVP
jgi:diacylglycerol kinase family enzyme